MTDRFSDTEAYSLLGDQVERAQAIGEIFDNAIRSADQLMLERILAKYPRRYLDEILGGYPDYVEETIEEGEQ